MSDAAEGVAGTDPEDASDVLDIIEANRTTDMVDLVWSSKADKTYDVQHSAAR